MPTRNFIEMWNTFNTIFLFHLRFGQIIDIQKLCILMLSLVVLLICDTLLLLTIQIQDWGQGQANQKKREQYINFLPLQQIPNLSETIDPPFPNLRLQRQTVTRLSTWCFNHIYIYMSELIWAGDTPYKLIAKILN